MSSRTYLSIGDVLTLLREEFPDVTISKIRFLESQGLVNPERSPSGYRKFFDHDVERLRWVLRQQREHFLPLKVIRDRLADGDLGDDVGAERPNGKAVPSRRTRSPSRRRLRVRARAADEGRRGGDGAHPRRRVARAAPAARAPQARRGLQVVAETEQCRPPRPEPAGPAGAGPTSTAQRSRRTPDGTARRRVPTARPRRRTGGADGRDRRTSRPRQRHRHGTARRPAHRQTARRPDTATPVRAERTADAPRLRRRAADPAAAGHRREPVGRGAVRRQRPVARRGGGAQGIRPHRAACSVAGIADLRRGRPDGGQPGRRLPGLRDRAAPPAPLPERGRTARWA